MTDQPSTYLGADLYNAVDVLTDTMKGIPAWRDLATVVTDVINHQVEEPRRRLARVRDPVRYRKDEIVGDLYYTQGDVTDTSSGELVTIEPGKLPSCKILEVVQNTGTVANPGHDSMVVEFNLSNGKTVHWTTPISALVERSLLVQTASMLGFDFFNNSLSNDDYHRIITYISQYYPHAGTPQFTNFIGFIKDIKLSSHPLWSYDDDTDTFPVLEKLPPGAVKATKGGPWYLTSHYELEFYPFRDGTVPDQFVINDTTFKDLENLFYLFAPIILVLERIVVAIDLDFKVFLGFGGQELSIFEAKAAFDYSYFTADQTYGVAGQEISLEFGKWDYHSFDNLSEEYNIEFASAIQQTSLFLASTKYDTGALESYYSLIAGGQNAEYVFGKAAETFADYINTSITASVAGIATEHVFIAYTECNYQSGMFLQGAISCGSYTEVLSGRAISQQFTL